MGDGPYFFVDELNDIAASGLGTIEPVKRNATSEIVDNCLLAISRVCNVPRDELPSVRKLATYSQLIVIGLFLGDAFNRLPWHRSVSALEKKGTSETLGAVRPNHKSAKAKKSRKQKR